MPKTKNENFDFRFIKESKVKKSNNKEDFFITNFKESKHEDKDSLIVTVEAIHAIVTGNYSKFTEEELKGSKLDDTGVYSWNSPYNKPAIKNHNARRGEPIGRVIEATFSKKTLCGIPGIILKIEVTDPEAIEKIKDGRYKTVSIGGKAEIIECSICGTDWVKEGWCEHRVGKEYDKGVMALVFKDITFIEISFVNVPADEYAVVIDYEHKPVEESKENYNTYTAFSNQVLNKLKNKSIKNTRGGIQNNMPKPNEEIENAVNKISSLFEEKLATKDEVEDLKEKNKKLREENTNLQEEIDNLKQEKGNLQEEVDSLNTKNKKFKEENKSILIEKIVELKLKNGVPEDKREDLTEKYSEKSHAVLKDIFEDLDYEFELKNSSNTKDPENNSVTKEGISNSDDSNVQVQEGDEENGDENFDIDEELNNLS